MTRFGFALTMALLVPPLGDTEAQQRDSPSLPIRIVVTDARGKYLKGLSAQDVAVYAGTHQQAVQSFAPVTGPRSFGILLDDYHVSAAAASGAASALLDFVDRHLRAEDTVLIVRPLDSASDIAPVTREELRERVSSFAGRKGNFAPRNAFESQYLSTAPPMAERQRAQIVRAAMQALATAMTAVRSGSTQAESDHTAKAMIVVTEGFAPEDKGRERLATLKTVARAARQGNVAVYVVDPSDSQAAATDLGEEWQQLTLQTGGVLSGRGEQLPSALARIAADMDASYVLTIPRPGGDDGRYERLDVKVHRKDAAVRAPSAYWAPIAAERLVAPFRPSTSTFLKTPHVTGLIQPWFRMSKATAGDTRVAFSWMPKPSRAGAANITFSAITFEGKNLIESAVAASGATSGTVLVFEAPSGPIQVTMAIADAGGKLLGTEVRYIDVPALDAAGATIAAVEIVRTRTVREFRERQLAADVMPAQSTEFDRRDRLIVRVRAFSQSGATPHVEARLLNPLGHLLRQLTPLPPVDGVPQFDLPLASYARGDYRVEVRATAGTASVSQLVMFRLIG